MDNITHSLVGTALAELVLPAQATTARRRLFYLTGIAAANLPDADLLYTRITPPPLGYLLHHRGHTHTLVGLAAQALLIGLVVLLPSIRLHLADARARWWGLIALALTSHLVLDSWNSYGVHPFWPVDARWYYGDVVYIAEPWIWLFLGTAAALNTRSGHGRLLLAGALAAIVLGVTWFRIIPVGSLLALAAGVAATIMLLRSRTPRRRSGVALALVAAFVAAMAGVRQRVHAQVLASMTPAARAGVVDVVLNPQPANPLCWNVLAIASDERAGEYAMTRGTSAVLGTSGCGPRGASVRWNDAVVRQSLARLRTLHRDDCSVRAWLQFGRAPELGEQAIGDLRFGGANADNFSTMPLMADGTGAACPRNLTDWEMPRRDLIEPRPEQR